MSGLAAFFRRDGQLADLADVGTVWAMLASVPYRGPDGMFVEPVGEAVLGSARMVVTPEDEGELQPLVSPRTACVVIADVRLDNRDELLRQLPGNPAASVGDAELVLRAYEMWGTEAVSHLLGDFAFILWDPRSKQMVCARDTSGQRTLFYRATNTLFVAASEIHQLFQDPSVPIAPNEEHIRDFLVPSVILQNAKDQAPTTFYHGIYAVPAGHILVVSQERVSVRRFWDLAPPREIRYRTEGQYAEHFLGLFSEVVRARLRSSRPVGAMMSGGLDSSSIVCVAQELYRTERARDYGFTSFSLTFDGLECDENHFINEIQAKYGFAARYIPYASDTDWLQLEPRGFQHSPYASNMRIAAPLYAAASQAGVRVLLSGDVADSCIPGSWLVYDSLLRHRKFLEFLRRIQIHRRNMSGSFGRFVALNCVVPFLPLALQREIWSAITRRHFARKWDQIMPFWISATLQQELTEQYRAVCLARDSARRFASPARQAEYDQLYPPGVAPHPAPFPVEIWRPFADRRLHEFLLAIPPEQKFAPHPESDEFYAGSKLLLRNAMRDTLPESVRTRTTKTHFGSVFQEEVQRRWRDYETVFGPSGESELAQRGYIDQAQFWKRLQMLRDGVTGADFLYLLRIVGLETWLRGLRQPRSAYKDHEAFSNRTRNMMEANPLSAMPVLEAL